MTPRVLRLAAAAVAFGAAAALAKGQATDGVGVVSQLRSAAGNLSTPWLLVGFLAGTRCPTAAGAALAGAAVTLAALAAFYAVTAAVLETGGGLAAELRLQLSANRGYLQAGLAAGLVTGAVGQSWWLGGRRVRVSALVGAALMAEPVVLVALDHVWGGGVLEADGVPTLLRLVTGWGLSADRPPAQLAVYGAEFVVGVVLVFAATVRSPARRPPALP